MQFNNTNKDWLIKYSTTAIYVLPNTQGHSKKDYFTDVNIIYFLQSNFTFNSSLQKYSRLR